LGVYLHEDSCNQYIYSILGRHRRRYEDNIKIDVKEVGCGGMDWIELIQDRDRWVVLLNAVMNLRGIS
jgi:hypothetical protein